MLRFFVRYQLNYFGQLPATKFAVCGEIDQRVN